jgi:hypothetical protein
MLGPAGKLEQIQSNKDYPIDLDNLYSTIFSIHVTKTNQCNVTITTIGDTTVEFPPGSLISGAVYHIYIKKMIFDEEKASFIGYRLLKK